MYMLFYLKRLLMAKKKVNLSFLFLSTFVILFISIGFSALNQNLMISGDVNYYLKGNNYVIDCNGNRLRTTIPDNLSGLARIMAEQAYLDNGKSQYVTNCAGVRFTTISSNTNGKGVYEIASTKDDTYPIYYYRGAVEDNNVIFANHCWKAVRTTDTGGVKLIYNGEVENNECLSSRGTHVGYAGEGSAQTLTSNYYYGTDYNYTNGVFSLAGTLEQKTWNATNGPTLIGKYTCKSTSSTGTCSTLYLIESFKSDTQGYAISLNGDSTYGRFGTISFHKTNTSLSDAGYMSNERYTNGKLNHFEDMLGGNSQLSVNYWYADSIGWDSSTNKYYLVNPYKITSTSEYPSLVGKYTFSNSTENFTRNSVNYIANVEGPLYKYIYLRDEGDHTLSYFNSAITYGDSFTDNGNGTYTINNATTVHLTDWPDYYEESKHKFVCINATNNTCSNIIYSTDNTTMLVMYFIRPIEEEYKYGSSFTYNSNTNTYTLTNTVNIWNFTDSTNRETMSTHHYTCRNLTGTCTTLYYAYYAQEDTLHFILLTGGKSMVDAANEMLNNSSVNTNNSVIKTGIDAWYKKYLLSYNSYIEDVVYCNDRSMETMSSLNPNGGTIVNPLRLNGYYKPFSTSTPSLVCPRTVDSFSVSATIGNGKLSYPVGLLTLDESMYAGTYRNTTQTTYYLYNGSQFWTITPYGISSDYANAVATGSFQSNSNTNVSNSLRPVISLSPEVDIAEGGDGTEANPYIVDTSQMIYTTTFENDSWDTIVAAIKNGQYNSYNVGDTKQVDLGTLGTHTLRIANISSPTECETEGFSQTACGFVLEFADLIGTRAMNSSATNVGGWPNTTMRTYVNNDVYNALPEALRNGIINTNVVSGHGSTSGETNFTTTDKLYLLSSVEIYGANYTYDSLQTTGTRQLDYYSSIGLTTSNYSGAIKNNGTTATIWKLRSARNNNATYYTQVSAAGARGTGSATTAHGVSPAFRIGKSFETDSWETIVSNVQSGNTDYYKIGDTKQVDLGSLGTHTLRIANNSSPSECEANGFSQTACGFVLEFVDIITKRRIGSSATGGWPASEIRTYLNSTVYNALPEVIRNAVITTNAISGYEYGASTNYKSKDKIYLLSSVEIAGVNNSFDSVTLNHTRQLDYYSMIGANEYFRIEKEYNSTVTAWWMRSAASNQNNFWLDRDIMEITNYPPTQSLGISPAFRIGTSFDTDSWETIVSNVKSGNIGKYKVGDEKEVDMGSLGTHTVRIANMSTPSECETEGFSQTACGFVLEFVDLIGTRAMHSSATNVGGWPNTTMRTYVNNDVYNALPEALRNGIINTNVVSGHGSTSGETNFTTTDKLYLLSSVEIYGANYTYDSLQTTGTRQLDYYSSIGLTTSNYSGAIKNNGTTATIWKLRSARNNNATYYTQVSAAGARGTGSATTAHGVSPAFRIGKSFETDSWETIVSNVQSGNTDYYKIGDTKEVDLGDLGVHNLRLVNKSTPSECETNGFSQTACGFVLEFADAITKRRIKSSDNTDGGWSTSEIRTYLNSTVYNALPETIRNAIINTNVVSGYGCSASSCSNSGYYNNGQNYSTVDKLYLFSPNEIREYSNIDFAVTLEQTRQLDYYRENGVVRGYRDFAVKKFYNNTEVIWWLRDPCEDQRYYWYDESSDGEAMGENPTTSQGVAPAFRIG